MPVRPSYVVTWRCRGSQQTSCALRRCSSTSSNSVLSRSNPTAVAFEETRSAQRDPTDHHRHVRSGSSGAAARRTSALPPVATVVGLVAVGKSIPEILDACPYLVEQGVMQALAYARTPVRCAANPLMASASLD